MKLLECKYIEHEGLRFPVLLTLRAIIDYENLTGRNFWVDYGGEELKTEKLVQLFYATAKAGAKNEDIEFKYSYEQFLDAIDNHPEVTAIFYHQIQSGTPGEGGEKKK